MAENEDGQEKTEEPTPKRRREARRKGQVPRSRELNTVVLLVAGGGFLLLFGGQMIANLSVQLSSALMLERALLFDPRVLPGHLLHQVGAAFLAVAPLLGVTFLAAVLGPLAIGGANFTFETLEPKLERLDPIKGLKRIFSPYGMLELLKALGKFLVVAGVSGAVVWGLVDALLALGDEPLPNALAHAGWMILWTFFTAAASLIVVAALDVPFQLWNYKKELRMTRQEVRDEHKETDGKPEVKNRIRQLQHEMARRRMMAAVPKADVVIINPTHFAVALVYHAEQMAAPRLLAKGIDGVALAIRKRAEQYQIPCVTAPHVARAIYYTTELEQEIPAGLFVAVARILAYVYKLKRHDETAEWPQDLPVPERYLDPTTARHARREDA